MRQGAGEDVGEEEESLNRDSKGSITQQSKHTPDPHHSTSKKPSLSVDRTLQLTPFPPVPRSEVISKPSTICHNQDINILPETEGSATSLNLVLSLLNPFVCSFCSSVDSVIVYL